MPEVNIEELFRRMQRQQSFTNASLSKQVDNIRWELVMRDVAEFDMHRIPGPPPKNTTAQSWQDKGNPVVFTVYTFVPKGLDKSKKHPMVVYVHGGVHSDFRSGSNHVIKELLAEGYVVISPDYRGSTGYGQGFWQLIDYGGLEIEDTFAARNWAVEHFDFVDPQKVGIIGWSHGGLHALFNIFNHPEFYQVAYAGVPVSDLVARMGYKGESYHGQFAADHHIGKYAWQNPQEYRRRSPAWHAEKLQTPLLIHTNTNDEDVNVLEVEHLIKALKAEGKEFTYKIYENAPGGHSFNRIDTPLAVASRQEIYTFLAKYLKG
ncbi:MAG: prolyl oligopeptidase family serine peptidase [Symbiobacteriaceae bacterium]|nr:prolyl oligopeptidase family serine peptidase [Symbiobacteriaceae bacterium]